MRYPKLSPIPQDPVRQEDILQSGKPTEPARREDVIRRGAGPSPRAVRMSCARAGHPPRPAARTSSTTPLSGAARTSCGRTDRPWRHDRGGLITRSLPGRIPSP